MNGSQRLAQVFVELADTLVEQFDVVDFLQMLTDRCVEMLDVDASGLMLADQRGSLQLLASTMERARLLELFELQIEQGPCLDCFTSGRSIVNVGLADAADRWPVFSPIAVELGFATTNALPMRLRGQVIGALNLFSDDAHPLAPDDVAVGQAMADIATIGLLHERSLSEQTILAEQLQGALHSRVLIEQAKGMLAARAGISVTEAFAVMRAHARSTGMKLTGVAAGVADGSIAMEALVRS